MLFHSPKRFTRFFAVPLAIIGTAVFTLGSVPSVNAQGYGNPPEQQQPPQAAPDLSEKDLQLFAQASVKVSDISRKWQAEISKTQNPNKMTEMQRQASQEMAEAVREEGLSIKKYNAIFKSLQEDPSIRQKVEKMREEVR